MDYLLGYLALICSMLPLKNKASRTIRSTQNPSTLHLKPGRLNPWNRQSSSFLTSWVCVKLFCLLASPTTNNPCSPIIKTSRTDFSVTNRPVLPFWQTNLRESKSNRTSFTTLTIALHKVHKITDHFLSLQIFHVRCRWGFDKDDKIPLWEVLT